MATVTVCDRCTHQGQTIPVLGKDVCVANCVPQLRIWLAGTPQQSGMLAMGHSVLAAAHEAIRQHKFADTMQIAKALGLTRRQAYDSLIRHSYKGRLKHVAKGRFVLPEGARA